MFHAAIETTDSDPVERDGVASAVPPTDSDHPVQEHPDGLRDGELYFQRCSWCRTAVFRRLLCPICASTDMPWEPSGGMGVVRHITVVGRSTGAPRALAIIEMSEGFRLRSRIIGVPPENVRVGTLVRLTVDASHPQELAFQPCDFSRANGR
ncbi:putative OB-fold protein [Streptomyces sp. V4I23]|uniref:Zn-ribbon domain-containing OB-fold protein n=1 Tax=Streptomyces sp. V4I23 TaxID=3042282 RepID=UPI00278AF909|nr:OB-fold domain-containing protein [Streptomyces sp. V4I23]MDQ1006075.1 putative OB-fold protein [Streptomyces sp. V4I23]